MKNVSATQWKQALLQFKALLIEFTIYCIYTNLFIFGPLLHIPVSHHKVIC
jgi:hypothetical protein